MAWTYCLLALLSPLLLPSPAKAETKWTFVFAENQTWQAQTIALDQHGWPRLIATDLFKNRKLASSFASRTQAVDRPPVASIPLRNKNGRSLWAVTQQWDWNWELKYADWVKTVLHPRWWKENGIATDCADVVYSARWIFARNNGLPMANHLITGHVFSHESVRPDWEGLPTASDWQNDQLFLAALDYLLSQAFTHTLWRDSYPVAINMASIMPGGYHLYIDQESGHTQFIYQVGRTASSLPLLTLNSTVPRELRDLMEWVFFESYADINSRGFVRMRWPLFQNGNVRFVDPTAMPHFSNEQFDANFVSGGRDTFWREVYHRINPRADFDLIAQRVVQQVVDQFKARVPVVDRGYQECSLSPCLPGTQRYDTWSTPSRDRRIGESIAIFDSLSSMITSWSAVRRIMQTPILVWDGYQYNGSDFMTNWRTSQFTSDPNDTPSMRWGID
jgi:hypothetical protein